ncbi:hypothetical protein ASPSYDRAFT_406276 [Aspergillus sydowii CBS 593.65]|uniref:Zn(2)-C6 fungal-type domain-containing protein n=1 Tax=Aspergillus sydowii CBS 593.65 TaxID=1036612 RepID=A0A1L9T9Q9_9EURO|nr:uncharacterized protein ASPSYDRAFT_406276 [Aspergillus sydowii CBS 593.65]OJJ56180.1 hypothetical protein ASPSYDRAFT_406276 [Aspergillus sydowii CBS 593.65]
MDSPGIVTHKSLTSKFFFPSHWQESNMYMGRMENFTHTRTCRRCSQKKIRYNKHQPCDSCSRSGSACVFPGPSRAPRRRKQPLKAQFLSHLKSLEEESAGSYSAT